MTSNIAINGKWLSQATTGTQRYAEELVRNLATKLQERAVVHVPSDAVVPAWLEDLYEVRRHGCKGQVFEQLSLPWASRNSFLLNLVGPAPLMKRRQLVTMHDAAVFRFPRTHSRYFRYWYRIMFTVLSRRAKILQTVSQFSARELASVLRIPVSRFQIVPNGSDHVDRLEPRMPQQVKGLERPYVLCLGTMAEHKNLSPILRLLDTSGISVVVVGAAATSKIFGATGPIHGQNLHFSGRLQDNEIAWLYEQAQLLIFPSLYEGFGLPVLEAQRLRCPVVCSNAASLPEVAGRGAAFYDPNDAQKGLNLVEQVMESDGMRKSLAEAGHANSRRYLWADSAIALAESIKAATSGKN